MTTPSNSLKGKVQGRFLGREMLLMNQMNPMNLFRGLRYIKKYFLCMGGKLAHFRFIQVHRAFFWLFYHNFYQYIIKY